MLLQSIYSDVYRYIGYAMGLGMAMYVGMYSIGRGVIWDTRGRRVARHTFQQYQIDHHQHYCSNFLQYAPMHPL